MTKLVKFLKNDGEMSNEICELIETVDNICRIKKNSGEIIRIYNDRIFLIDDDLDKSDDLNKSQDCKFNPWSIHRNAEVWVKSNHFSDVVICETYAVIIDDIYFSCNVYNGILKSKFEYKMLDINKLRIKLQKKEYKKLQK